MISQSNNSQFGDIHKKLGEVDTIMKEMEDLAVSISDKNLDHMKLLFIRLSAIKLSINYEIY